jgi:hypothetical protein
MKKCSASLSIKEMKIKVTLRCHLIPDNMTIIKKTKTANAGKDAGRKGTLIHS